MNQTTVLIIDDEAPIRRMLTIALSGEGYKVLSAENAKLGLQFAANHSPDVILLDLGLPDMDGHTVLTTLRTWYNFGVIMLSAIDEEAVIVRALDAGATDYITKPFRIGELLARIRTALRLHQHSEQPITEETFNQLTIDYAAHVVKKAGEILHLTATEFKLMAFLAKNAGRVLTHQYILKSIWGVAYQTETQYLRVFIATLRKKIEENPNQPQHILTENRIGYRFQ
jgi:two-component system, OmpR family, KDP operon response regulator KdpE